MGMVNNDKFSTREMLGEPRRYQVNVPNTNEFDRFIGKFVSPVLKVGGLLGTIIASVRVIRETFGDLSHSKKKDDYPPIIITDRRNEKGIDFEHRPRHDGYERRNRYECNNHNHNNNRHNDRKYEWN